jgi:hypothetical protein
MNKYEWKLKSLAKGIDPDVAIQELERIESIYGILSPENVLNESRDQNAILHPLFEWQEDVAAEKYRLQQARFILNNVCVKVVKDGNTSLIPVYEVVTTNDKRGYKSVTVMTQADAEQVRKSTIRDLLLIQNKLKAYEDFENTRIHIQNAVDDLGAADTFS